MQNKIRGFQNKIPSDCRKTLILVIVPIKSAGKFEYNQSKGTLFLAKRPLLKNSPPGCFVNHSIA